jgi:hypothetical protein
VLGVNVGVIDGGGLQVVVVVMFGPVRKKRSDRICRLTNMVILPRHGANCELLARLHALPLRHTAHLSTAVGAPPEPP